MYVGFFPMFLLRFVSELNFFSDMLPLRSTCGLLIGCWFVGILMIYGNNTDNDPCTEETLNTLQLLLSVCLSSFSSADIARSHFRRKKGRSRCGQFLVELNLTQYPSISPDEPPKNCTMGKREHIQFFFIVLMLQMLHHERQCAQRVGSVPEDGHIKWVVQLAAAHRQRLLPSEWSGRRKSVCARHAAFIGDPENLPVNCVYRRDSAPIVARLCQLGNTCCCLWDDSSEPFPIFRMLGMPFGRTTDILYKYSPGIGSYFLNFLCVFRTWKTVMVVLKNFAPINSQRWRTGERGSALETTASLSEVTQHAEPQLGPSYQNSHFSSWLFLYPISSGVTPNNPVYSFLSR